MKPKQQLISRPRRAWRLWAALAVSGVLSLLPLLMAYWINVPLGETGKFVYRYSTFLPNKLLTGVLVAAPIGGVLTALWLLTRPRLRALGWLAGVLAISALVAWNFWAPLVPMMQHAFNLRSPSHDGAFLEQAEQIEDLPQYLREFDRLSRRSKEEMRGTRVIANPPGMTVFFYAVLSLFPSDPIAPGWIERQAISDGSLKRSTSILIDHAAKAAIACAAVLALAGVAAMGLGRQFLSPIGAFAFAVIVVFNPMTVHFNPGKDPDQLLTVCLMLWAWFAGYRRRSWALHALAGALLVLGMGVGVIHFWVALAALLATAWEAKDEGGRIKEEKGKVTAFRFHPSSFRLRPFLLHHVLPTCLGGAAVWLILWSAVGWNLLATLLAVSRRWSELQPELGYSRGLWLLIGLPNVLVFVGFGIWLSALASLRRILRPRSLGAKLTLCTLGIMALTYVIGIPYELPRLWVVFVPPLLLGLMMIQPLARGRSGQRVATIISVLLVTHIATTAMHWAFLDARESEYRLRTKRMFD